MQARVKQPAATMIEKDPDDTAFAPTPQELERLLFAVESSLQVNKRFQFFLWAQGVLQTFLPHAKLICAYGDLDAGQYTIDVFSSDNVATAQSDTVDASVEAFVELALAHWDANGRTPLLLSSEAQAQTPDEPVVQAVWEAGLGHVMAHGTAELQGPNASFFVFARLPKAPRRRAADVLEIMLPHLHLAMFRCARDELKARAAAAPKGPTLSQREVQIMRGVRDGLTNSDIGLQLDISPLTVKNHVQRILRKLGVGNRIQAVTRCMSMGVFDSKQYGEGLKMLLAGLLTAMGLMLSDGVGAQSLDERPFTPVETRTAPKSLEGKPMTALEFAALRRGPANGPLTEILDSAERLIAAITRGDIRSLRSLVQSGRDPNSRLLDGTTPLTVAVHRTQLEAVRILLASGADPSLPGLNGQTPLHLAIEGNQVEIAQRLLRANANANQPSRDGYRAADFAALLNRAWAIPLLAGAGAQLDVVGKQGTPLTLCSSVNASAACIALLRAKADPNLPNAAGQTPLFFATQNQNALTARALLAAGADPGAISMAWID
jgi:transcriptional regulator EpsA